MTAGTFYLNKQNHTITTLKAMLQGNSLRSRTCMPKSLKDITWSIYKKLGNNTTFTNTHFVQIYISCPAHFAKIDTPAADLKNPEG